MCKGWQTGALEQGQGQNRQGNWPGFTNCGPLLTGPLKLGAMDEWQRLCGREIPIVLVPCSQVSWLVGVSDLIDIQAQGPESPPQSCIYQSPLYAVLTPKIPHSIKGRILGLPCKYVHKHSNAHSFQNKQLVDRGNCQKQGISPTKDSLKMNA